MHRAMDSVIKYRVQTDLFLQRLGQSPISATSLASEQQRTGSCWLRVRSSCFMPTSPEDMSFCQEALRPLSAENEILHRLASREVSTD